MKCLVALCCLLAIAVIPSIASPAFAEDPLADKSNVMTARCRAQCLNKFHVAGSDRNCFDNGDCWMCWDTCNLFYSNFKVWGVMCEQKDICFPGCQESCKFYRSSTELIEATRTDTQFVTPLRYTYEAHYDSIRFEWTRPEGNDQIEPVVYVLMVRDDLSSGWHQVEQTFYNNATIRRGLLRSTSVLRLTAYDSNGKIAELEKPVAEFDFTNDGSDDLAEYELSSTLHMGDVNGNHNRTQQLQADQEQDVLFNTWLPTIESLRFSSRNLGGVEAAISWPRISEVSEEQAEGIEHLSTDFKYEVEWKHADNQMDIIGHLFTKNNHVSLTLWPNSLYEVTIRAYSTASAAGSGSPRRLLAEARSRSLLIDTSVPANQIHPLRQHLQHHCPGCARIEYLAGGAAAIATLAFLICVVLVVAKICCRRTDTAMPSAEKGFSNVKPTDIEAQISAHLAATTQQHQKKNSLRQQLSSLPHFAAAASIVGAGRQQHSILIEESPSPLTGLPSTMSNAQQSMLHRSFVV